MRSLALFSAIILIFQQGFFSASSSRTARLKIRFNTAIVRLTLAGGSWASLHYPQSRRRTPHTCKGPPATLGVCELQGCCFYDPGLKGVAYPKFANRVHSEENLCYLGSHRTIWPKKRNLFRIELGMEVLKPFFDCGAKAAA